jgi:hypothetical protein
VRPGRDLTGALGAPLRLAILDRDGVAFDPAELAQPLHKGSSPRTPGQLIRAEDPNGRLMARLRSCGQRPNYCYAAEKPDEFPPPHGICFPGREPSHWYHAR